MTVVVLALLSAALFGAMTVAVRMGIKGMRAETAAVATMLPALAIALAAALPRGGWADAWPFFLAGLVAPGASQILFALSIREAGPARSSVAVGTAPLVAVVLAVLLLDEPLKPPLVAGAVLVVGGGIALVWERDRPEHVRAVALLYAVGATVLFASRDALVRALHAHANPETAAAATLVAGTIVALAAAGPPRRDEVRRLAPAGILFGVSYLCLFEAYFRGRVTVVSPLVATESLWGVGLSALVLRRTEGVGRRLALGAVLVVAGGALIGATR
ncbi:MAG TPA: DMT family transporter [Gaiellaceae bacterium]|jgi:drug/metabolite transporter (DMT)-like permease